MNRRAVIRTLGAAAFACKAFGEERRFSVLGSGPTILALERMPAGYYDELAKRYRVVVIADPAPITWQEFIESYTIDHVCADMLSVAEKVGAARFAWYGFSWGAVVGLQMAIRTNRLTALACGGWPPLGGQYRETLAAAEAMA